MVKKKLNDTLKIEMKENTSQQEVLNKLTTYFPHNYQNLIDSQYSLLNSSQQQLQHQNFLRQEPQHKHPHLQQSQIQGISHKSDPRVKVPSENFDNISKETQPQFSHLHNQGSNNSFDPRVEVPFEKIPHRSKGQILIIGQSGQSSILAP